MIELINMDILIGTKNTYKSAEMDSLLEGLDGIKIHYLDELDLGIKVQEDQNSLIGNASKKAMEISKHTDCYVLASDGGVDIPGLGDKWDVLRNQRIVGEDKTDREKVNKLMELMTGLKYEERKCMYHLALALAKDGKLIWSIDDTYDKGYIVEKPSDKEISKGKWMASIWFYPQHQNVFTELNSVQINEVRQQGNLLKERLQEEVKKYI
jgi:inosine/xanthosine triphosphate pyrophosphatase family protein